MIIEVALTLIFGVIFLILLYSWSIKQSAGRVSNMKKCSEDIPSWLLLPEVEKVSERLLDASRKDMFEALSLFHNHVKYVISIMISVPAIVFGVVSLMPAMRPNLPAIALIAGLVLIAVSFVSLYSIRIIHKYYQVYVSALVFATIVHIKADYKRAHPWFIRTVQQAKKAQAIGVNNIVDFMEYRTKSSEDSYHYYKTVIYILSTVILLSGILLAFFYFISIS